MTPTVRPSILMSYAHWAPWIFERYDYRDWCLDSGAYTAWKEGKPIELGAYMDFCFEVREKYPRLKEIFALDVIGDAEATVRNAETMTKAGLTVVPTFHLGSAEEFLYEIARNYEKIALGGMVSAWPTEDRGPVHQPKRKWAEQCFARVWPKKIHGFGLSGKQIEKLPWHSVDFSNWIVDPVRFGVWHSYGHKQVSVRNPAKIKLSVEVEHYRRMETRLRRWQWPDMTIYMAVAVGSEKNEIARYDGAFPLKAEKESA